MCRLACFAVFFLAIISTGSAFGQSVSLDHVDGLTPGGDLETGVPITFYIRITGDDTSHAVIGHGFRIHSQDAAQWTTTTGDTTGALGSAQFDLLCRIYDLGSDGTGMDGAGFVGVRAMGTGLPSSFDDVVFTIQIGPIDESFARRHICLDSIFVNGSNPWKWWGPVVIPDWDGPHCFQIACEPDSTDDDDNDGVTGSCDNCPEHYNPQQENTDGDHLGDLCDDCPNDVSNDYDEDGVCGDVDNCPTVYNPDQTDTDEDDIGDACAAMFMCVGIRGNVDADHSDEINISDLVFLVDFMFIHGPAPPVFEEADMDATGEIDIADLVLLVEYMFTGGPPPEPCP